MESKQKQATANKNQAKVDQTTSIFDNQVQSPWMSADQAWKYLGFKNINQLYDCVHRGQIAASRIGRRLRFNKNRLDRWLLSQQ